jgi:hypothetical protein
MPDQTIMRTIETEVDTDTVLTQGVSSAVGVMTRQLSGCMSFEDFLTCNPEVAIEHEHGSL